LAGQPGKALHSVNLLKSILHNIGVLMVGFAVGFAGRRIEEALTAWPRSRRLFLRVTATGESMRLTISRNGLDRHLRIDVLCGRQSAAPQKRIW
jgi:hypothetical protein